MPNRIVLSGLLLAGLGYACISGRHETQAEDESPADVVRTQRAADVVAVETLETDVRIAARLALLMQEEIGWNEFATDRVIDPDVQKLARNMIAERQRLLSELKSFAPDATRPDYLNKTAKDARLITDTVAKTETRVPNRLARTNDRRRDEQEVDRLSVRSRLDRRSAELARIASYRGSVIAAIRNSTGLQSPVINPPADNTVSNPAAILPGVTEGGSLNPPVAGIKAPGADSAAGVGIGAVAGAAAAPAAGGSANSGVGAAGANVTPGNVAAGNAGNAGNSPSGLLSGPAASNNSNATPAGAAANGPTGLLSGPGAGVQGPQSGTTSSKNPTGLLSGPAAGRSNSTGTNQTSQTAAAAANRRSGNSAGTPSRNRTSTSDASKNQAATAPNVNANGNTLAPAIGVTGDGGVVAGTEGDIGPFITGTAVGASANGAASQEARSVVSASSQGDGTQSNEAGNVSSTETRTLAFSAADSADRDFDVVQVERQLAVQSLAGSKWLLEQSPDDQIDIAYLRQELSLQKDLLNQITVLQRYASSDLNEVLAKAERALLKDLSATETLVEQ